MNLGKRILSVLLMFSICSIVFAKDVTKKIYSPDKRIEVTITAGNTLTYSVQKDGIKLMEPSEIYLKTNLGITFGQEKLKTTKVRSVKEELESPIYKKSIVENNFNEIRFIYKNSEVIFRAYDDGVAYRFVAKAAKDFLVEQEKADFEFPKDWKIYLGYASNQAGRTIEQQFRTSFENLYEFVPMSKWDKDRLAFLPVLVDVGEGTKICVTESNLLDYPGMFVYNPKAEKGFTGIWAPYPKEVKQGGHNSLQELVQSREDYLAKVKKDASMPWRIIIISSQDKDLPENDMVWKLADAPKGDFSWVKPGKVAWEWWHNWSISGVDFKAGINNRTYEYYIDFAAKNNIEYILMDEGWAIRGEADLFKVVPDIDLQKIVDYADSKGVGVMIWAGYYAFKRDMEKACKYFSEMGIKGFKIDFMDRDDQEMVQFYEDAAKMCAKYHLLIDFHGAFKPAGMTRTYPNVLNFEGVYGLENQKWREDKDYNAVEYDVTIPFIRMVAGPMDYTQGAMLNGSKGNYRAIFNEPMSMGTRCRQIAEYVVFESPLVMLCDSPTHYMKEQECTDFITKIPTVWDETIGLNGSVAEYVTIARRKGDVWYIGSMNDWNERELGLNLDFLGEGDWTMEIFKDGINADRVGSDYAREIKDVPANRSVNVHMAPGGAWVARITKK